ncbi:hypothetical protein [Streptomyces sp. NPDC047981]|uniref:hypothetical protein n=1 Tax=Streptomyces sp. NPDC047981 TaxID=3154610 RepID=UPI0034150E5B
MNTSLALDDRSTTDTSPPMEATHYGIPVAAFGAEGAMLALGHHTPRRALAAFNRYSRIEHGLHNLADDRTATVDDWLPYIRNTWVVFRTPDPARGDDTDCLWYAGPALEGTPNAQPVTILAI